MAMVNVDRDIKDWERLYQHNYGAPYRITLIYGSFRRELVWAFKDGGEVDDAITRLHLPPGVTVRWEPIREVLLLPR